MLWVFQILLLLGLVACAEVPNSQISGLEYLYNSTNGDGWNWIPDYANYGIPWNFSAVDDSVSNPCVDRWQGIQCSTNCTTDSSITTCNITTIFLMNFNLIGTLPPQIGLLPQLNNLILFKNELYGSVPTEISLMTELHVFNVSKNMLTGAVFDTLLSNHQLGVISVSDNKFEGTIPNSVYAQQPGLAVLVGYNNSFTGTIPATVGQIGDLQVFYFAFNKLTGGIPTQLGSLSALMILSLDFNSLHGTIPNELGSLTTLEVLSLYSLGLEGTIPSTLMSMPALYAIALSFNELTGTIPTTLGTLSSLIFFGVAENFLTGSVDGLAELSKLPRIHNLLLSENFLTGNLDNFEFSSSLEFLRINENLFSGDSMLEQLCSCPLLQEFLLDINNLGGPIPPCFGDIITLTSLDMSENRFSGQLPATFSQLVNLSVAVLASNAFSGPLSNLPHGGMLTTVLVADNQFTGTLPYDIFNSSLKLESFSATKNCFSGSLSSEICFATGLVSLDISGLTSGTSCVVTTIFGTYDIKAVPGAIPVCIFEMPNLEAFYAAGNGIASPLFDNIPASSVLRNLSLSNNRITGPIPYSLQTHKGMHLLDLSHNRLLGTIEHMGDFTLDHNTDLILKANQLSGYIPRNITVSDSAVDILDGNVFDCQQVSQLPRTDPDRNKYSCGSNLLDMSVAGSGSIMVVLAGAVLISIMYHQAYKTLSNRYMAEMTTETLRIATTYLFSRHVAVPVPEMVKSTHEEMGILMDYLALFTYQYRGFALVLSVAIVCICLPVFVVIKEANGNEYSKVTYQYGWDVSLAYLQGVPPGVFVTLFWLFLIVGAVFYEFYYIDRSSFVRSVRDISRVTKVGRATHVGKDDAPSQKVDWGNAVWNVVLNVFMSLTVNALYVYVVITQPVELQTAAVMLLVMYKLGWLYGVVLPWFQTIQSHFVIVIGVMIGNVVLIPMIATMMVDVSCFQNLFVSQPPIKTHFTFPICELFWEELTCLKDEDFEVFVSFGSPIIYNNNCFSALLYNYVPIYVVTYGVIGILVPVLQMMANVYYHAYRNEYKDFIHRSKQVEWFPMFFMLPITGIEDLVSSRDLAAGQRTPRAHFYLSRYNSLTMTTLLLLLITFGVAYPPLAAILAVNLALTSLAFQVTIYIHSKQIVDLPEECFEIWLGICETEIADMHKIIFGSRTVMYMFAAFYACFAIYDITALDSYVGAVVLIVLLIVLSFTSVQLMYYLRDLHVESELGHVDNRFTITPVYSSRPTAAGMEMASRTTNSSGKSSAASTSNPILAAKQAEAVAKIKAKREGQQ